mmetsp:Transcript_4588/g.5972  ORF Transcript_4588/g.5972 Transcript_4588/m.5972 type:complete len:138 (-) Transcript_4588:237-650(-)
MGNSNSGFAGCCISSQSINLKNENDGDLQYIGKKTGNASLAKTMSTSKQEVPEGYSFSSISSKSSNSNVEQVKIYEPEQVDMRNDAEWCHSISDEIRVAESSYDEATTEAVNNYYCESRHMMHYIGRRSAGHQSRDQ